MGTTTSGLWFEGMEKKMEITRIGGTTIRIHSFVPSQPKVRFGPFAYFGFRVLSLGLRVQGVEFRA